MEKLVYEVDIVLLQETRCKDDGYRLKIPRFRVIASHKNHGQAIIARNDVKVTELDVEKYESDGLQLMAVEVNTGYE